MSRQPSASGWALMPDAVPEAIEHDSPSAWARFNALAAGQDTRFEPTVPQTLPASLAQAARAGALPAAAPAPALAAVTLDEALREVRRLNRVCPRPAAWLRFHAALPPAPDPAPLQPPPDPQAWQALPALGKRLVLRRQLEWAQACGVLEPALRFLQALPEPAWLHIGED